MFAVPYQEKTKEHSQDSNPQTSKPVADALPLYHDFLQLRREGRYLPMFFAIFLKLRTPAGIILLSLHTMPEKSSFVLSNFFNTNTDGLQTEHDAHGCGRIHPQKKTTSVVKFAHKC